MKPLDDFLQKIMIYAPGVAIPTAYSGVRDAATEFCERTRLWRYEDEFTVSAADAEQITTPSGSVLLDLERVAFDGTPLEPKTAAWLDEHMDGWRTGALVGQPKYITQLEPNTLRLVPGQEGTVSISAWLKPSQDCTDLPDFMADQHREMIAFGALGRILMIPNQPYTNTDLAGGFLSAFATKLAGLSGAGITGQQRARVRTRASFF